MKENASQKKRIEKLIDTAIAFITVEDTRAYLEDEGDLTYDDLPPFVRGCVGMVGLEARARAVAGLHPAGILLVRLGA